MKSNIAAKLFLNNQNGQDIGLTILNTIVDTQNADLGQVINDYKDIISGKKIVAQVITSSELNDSQSQKIKKKIITLFKNSNLLFVFTIDASVIGGIKILVGDDKVKFNI